MESASTPRFIKRMFIINVVVHGPVGRPENWCQIIDLVLSNGGQPAARLVRSKDAPLFRHFDGNEVVSRAVLGIGREDPEASASNKEMNSVPLPFSIEG